MERIRRRLLGLALAAAVGVQAEAADRAPSRETDLTRLPSRTLDQFYWRVGSDLAAYRRAVVDAPTVEFAKDWLRRMNESRGVVRRIDPADAAQIADRMALAMRDAVTRVLVEQGYEIVTVAAPGVLRMSPSIVDLYVNAPYVPMPGIDAGIVHRDAGGATLELVVRDAANGTTLARIVDQRVARTIGAYERATSVSNLFWFEAMFRKWATDCIAQIRDESQPR